MAFTDHSDLFASVHEDGINLVVRHIMRQRPSLFNYATPAFSRNPELFCVRIEAAQTVLDAGNPLFTEQDPLPVLGAPVEIGLNFCLQLTDLQIDFHPGNAFELPPELAPLGAQRVALRMKACAGLGCPPEGVIEEVLPFIEELIFREQLESGDLEEGDDKKRTKLSAGRASLQPAAKMVQGFDYSPGAFDMRLPPPDVFFVRAPETAFFSSGRLAVPPMAVAPFPGGRLGREKEVIILPAREMTCFCLELFAVGHFEWGTITGSEQQWLKPRLDGIEIVDLQPTPMENSIECYLATTLRLGVLPNLMVPMEKLILDITATLAEQGFEIGEQVTLEPAAVPGDVPNNPAIEGDLIKVFINLNVTEGGS